MVSGVAHELNNPLQTVVGNAEMLVGMKLPDPAHRRAMRVLAGARRCQEAVDGLLKLTRKQPGRREALFLEEIIQRAVRRAAVELDAQRVDLRVQVAQPVPTILGDAVDLEQAFEHIVRNALQAVEHAPDPKVIVTIEALRTMAQIALTDNGAGMTSDARSRAFEPFFTTRGVGQGKGLGLSIALGIIEEHGGMIEIQPRAQGTQVMVLLPLPRGVE
jgi:signal transduction histidine kinase